MLSRALSLAAVTLLIGCFAADPDPAHAQATNLEAGKSPSQIFAGTCTACHKGPRGLLKTVPAGSLQGFLKQHYTTSPEMASLLAAFLTSNGANDTRYVGAQTKPGKDDKPEAKPGGPPDQLDRFGHRLHPQREPAKPEAEPQEAAKPDADGIGAQAEPERRGRNGKRLARPGEVPAVEGEAPGQAANERGPDGRKLSARQQKLGKRGKPGSEEAPGADSAKEEPAKGEAAKDDKPKSESAKVESGKSEGSKPEASKPAGEGKSESAKVEPPKDAGGGGAPATRPDPVPPVTPAPAASATSTAVSNGASEPSAAPPPAVTASVPPQPPVAPAGPPAPPISQ